MGACYSKTGHGADMSPNDQLPYEKATSINHQRNGHAKKDGYESLQTNEDHEDRNPQTSIGVDANKNVNPNSKDLIQDNSVGPEDAETCKMDYIDAVPIENTVKESDSGIVVEPMPCSPDNVIGFKNEQNTGSVRNQHNSDWYIGKDSTKEQPSNQHLERGRVLNLPLNFHIQSSTSDYVQTCSTFTSTPDSDLDDFHEGGSSTAKSDSSGKDSRGETTTNIDKIRQAIHRSTLSSPAEYSRSITEPVDRPSSSLSTLGPGEVTTMTIDGREVVLIDAEVYAQILEEIAFLKLKLSQLTQVIQDDEEESQNRTTENLQDSMMAISASYS